MLKKIMSTFKTDFVLIYCFNEDLFKQTINIQETIWFVLLHGRTDKKILNSTCTS